MIDPLLANYKKYPRMAHWFSPWLLAKLLNNVIVSSMFGRYADRRLMIAALDTVDASKHFERATELQAHLPPDKDGNVWIDWVADLGDGFDSTYAVASLIGRKELPVGDRELPRAQALFMGGDEVYPTASEQAYRNQLRQPYAWAFPDHDKASDEGVPLFAIPGNHDWYDSLDLFIAFFCRGKRHTHFGSWRTQQYRSYFALQLTPKWWLWAVDIQLADNMDQPQFDYFTGIACRMDPNSKIILCSAEPGWLYTHTASKSWEIMDYVIGIANDANRNLSIPILISGDTHHYSRYSADDGTQFVTSGGGGAFLHPTHHLQNKISVKWRGTEKPLSLTTSPDAGHAETKPKKAACYPTKWTSRCLLLRNIFFALKNWGFSILMGIIYWIMAIGLTLRDQWDAYAVVAIVFAGCIMSYAIKQEKSKRSSVIVTSALHSAAHTAAVIYFSQLFARWNDAHFVLTGEWYDVWKWLGILLAEMGVVGFFVGSTIFAFNLIVTSTLFRMNYNDAFSALRLGSYNNFLRIKINGDHLETFAIGLRDVPHRDGWKANPEKRSPDQPAYIPVKLLEPHLIERITV